MRIGGEGLIIPLLIYGQYRGKKGLFLTGGKTFYYIYKEESLSLNPRKSSSESWNVIFRTRGGEEQLCLYTGGDLKEQGGELSITTEEEKRFLPIPEKMSADKSISPRPAPERDYLGVLILIHVRSKKGEIPFQGKGPFLQNVS